MVLQGAIAATGYRFTTPPSDPSKLDADDLLQGGPAVSIEGNVAKGIILAVPPKDNSTTDNDEDDDGIEDAKEGAASIISYGSAAALRIGSAGAIAIGATEGTGTGFGLIVDGGILGDGLYTGVDGNALQIGGLGGTVSIANGIGVTGIDPGQVASTQCDRGPPWVRAPRRSFATPVRSSPRRQHRLGRRHGDRDRGGRQPPDPAQQRRDQGHHWRPTAPRSRSSTGPGRWA